jgi:hypothetical protein
MTAVPERDQGVAAGTINTTEQLGGAVGIAVLTAVELGTNFAEMDRRFAEKGIDPTPEQEDRFRDFLVEAEQKGLNAAESEDIPGFIKDTIEYVVASHVDAFQVLYSVSAAIALVGAIAAAVLIRKSDRLVEGPVFGRRSRWVYATAGTSPAITRRPPSEPGRPTP